LGDFVDTLTFVLIIAGIALLVQAGLALIVGYLAAKRGRSAVAYFWLSFLLTFVIGLIVLLIQTSGSQQVKRDYQNPNFGFLDGERAAKCPKCAEWIKVEASVCKHCGHEVGEYIQAQMHAQQAEESARIEKLETQLAAEREASQAARTKMLKSKKFRLFAAAGTVVVVGLVAFISTSLVRNEMAKQPAPVTKVIFDFDAKKFCPFITVEFDVSLAEVRRGISATTYFENSWDVWDGYSLVFDEEKELRGFEYRDIGGAKAFNLDEADCRNISLTQRETWSYEIFGNSPWNEEDQLLYKGSVEIPWQTPQFESRLDYKNDSETVYQVVPTMFTSSATSLEFVGLTDDQEQEQLDRFAESGSLSVNKGKAYTVEFKNPAGSQIIKLDGR
jgi:hypothetical protein